MKDNIYRFLIFLTVSFASLLLINNTIDFIFGAILIFIIGLAIFDLKTSIIFLFLSRELFFKSYLYYTGFTSSPFSVTIYHVVLAFLLLLLVLREKHLILLDSFRITLLIFTVYLIFSASFVSDYKSYGFEKLFYLFFILFNCYSLMVLLPHNKLIPKFFIAIFYHGFFLLLLSLIVGLNYKLLNGQFFLNRFTVLGLNPIWIARFLIYAVLVNVYLIYKNKNILFQISLVIISMFQFYYAFITGSRGPIIALLAGLISFFLFYYRIKLSRLVFIALIFSLLIFTGYQKIKDDSSNRFLGGGSGKTSNNARILAQVEAYTLFRTNIVVGGGFGSFKQFYLVYPHNIISEITSETGLIGLSLFLLLLLITAYRIKKLYFMGSNLTASILVAMLVISFLNANLSGHVGYNAYFWLSLFILNQYYLNHEEDQTITKSIIAGQEI